eukprot:40132-Chlamydomonas_euryale.AAC.3
MMNFHDGSVLIFVNSPTSAEGTDCPCACPPVHVFMAAHSVHPSMFSWLTAMASLADVCSVLFLHGIRKSALHLSARPMQFMLYVRGRGPL